jgi:aldehyde dehydrogenase (NAD+)
MIATELSKTTKVSEVPEIPQIIQQQRLFFAGGKTKSINFRIEQLQKLKQVLVEHKAAIIQALQADLGKPEFESYISEIYVIKEIEYALKNIRSWTKPKKASVPLAFLQYSAKIYPEPLGSVLIIGAWNYPIQLVVSPLIGAIAAGNCAILKPSEFAPHTSSILAEIFHKYFPPEYIKVIEGDIEISQKLLGEKFDHIFFTGSTSVGKIVMEAAAKQLTPVTLELGGKSPCIVDTDIHLEQTIKRIAWGKFLNAGQSCIAPDYLLVHTNIKADLLSGLQKCLQQFYSSDPDESPDYARIINQQHFHRLVNFLNCGQIVIGGEVKPEKLYIAPTVVTNVSLNDPIMQEEIFGPILPVIEYQDITEAIALINSRPKPLALYLFTLNHNLQQRILEETSSGGVVFNDTVLQFGLTSLPFGGIGDSGIGSYHGKKSFDTFSHEKSVLHNTWRWELNWRYAPYKGKLSFFRKIMNI